MTQSCLLLFFFLVISFWSSTNFNPMKFPALQSFPLLPAPDGDPTKPKKTSKGKKKTKKSEPTDLSMFDENAPSIFDDSLSALGQ